MKSFIENLCDVELDRVTAAEICIDELLTIMDRRGGESKMYSSLKTLSSQLSQDLRDAEGMDARHQRIIRVRRALSDAFPMTDDDLEIGVAPV